jgi:hypothetical protein
LFVYVPTQALRQVRLHLAELLVLSDVYVEGQIYRTENEGANELCEPEIQMNRIIEAR